jgi:protein-S-isoprenylcysteine O-methyltransferase Ste14
MGNISSYIVAGCWLIFFGYWVVSAFRVKRTVERPSIAATLAHRIPVMLAWCLMLLNVFPPLQRRILPHTDPVMVTGAAVCVLGLLVTLWARWTLAGNWSADVTFKQDHELVRRGPYRFVRHPIYTGLLIMATGTAVGDGRLRCWLGVAVLALGLWVKLSQEERLMLRHFPEAYPIYKKEAKALVPWII